MRVFTILSLTVLLTACISTKKNNSTANLEEVYKMMTGSFNSEKQAANDSTYYDITLQMYPIWAENDDAKWLYVEQAVTAAPERPYRQRVYRITQEGNKIISAVYSLPNPKGFIGAWKTPEKFDNLKPEDLKIKEGCDVVLKKTPKGYVGSTGENSCISNFRGAAYATSEVMVYKDQIISWDRGFDADGKYIWGAEKAGYVFDRIK